tara:strand:+ start:536 stop:802 length:267 start_codon:yes stop_codon:yes gene_type:complete
MAKKSDYVVTLTTDVVKKEKWLIRNETKEDAIWIAENMNQSKLYDCTLLEEDEDQEDFELESAKEVVFTKRTDFQGHKEDKYFWKEIE